MSYYLNKTLKEYLDIADDTHQYFNKFGNVVRTDILEKKMIDIQICIKNLQSVSKKLADVNNIYNTLYLMRKEKKSSNKYINTYPTENDHAVLRMKENIDTKEVIDGIKIPVKIVDSTKHIPLSNIYYVNDIKQYVINIAGVNIRGNLANIVKYKSRKTSRCEYSNKCSSFKKGISCNYYHDPEDYIINNLPVSEEIRNFTIGSWIYCSNRNPRNYYTRHIGSKNTLLHDIKMLKTIQYREEIANREGQLIHDLLVYMILHNKGLLERYPHWY